MVEPCSDDIKDTPPKSSKVTCLSHPLGRQIIEFASLIGDSHSDRAFGCRNSLISDEWRAMVLTFHNDKRKTLARGDQPGKDGNKLSPAKQMNELTWDCNLERFASDAAAQCKDYDDPQRGVNQKTQVLIVPDFCSLPMKKTETVLNEWWNEVTVVGLGADLKYTDNSGLEEFANCLNVSAANDDQCADDGMTNDMTNSALYMHNYYRGLLGTGWAEDKISTYAPLAKAMPQLNYECGTIAKEAKDRAQACKETPDDPTAPRSQNYLVIKDLSMDKEDALKQAISTWWKGLADVGLGEDTTYKAAMKNTLGQFANMAYDQTKQVGCSVETCTKQGFTLVVCQYDKLISDGKKIYETGKSGDKACAGCATTKCGDLQGLCAP
ncbi:SCP-like protein [Necator americanus]|uniref:SCP-like protein n=1 Tax=Necator americanus TaxID=51031 RepID=W2TXK1_NECAM|nr:SCP-like protein [Necator americanus]ETN86790.1 SCP-like protein [Necator americanus]